MIQAVSSQAGNPSFGESVLPWRSKGSANLFESKPINSIAKFRPVDLVVVANQKTTRQVEWASFHDLLCGPLRGRMLGHIKVKDSAPLKAQDEEHLENAKRRSEIYALTTTEVVTDT